MAKDTIDFSGMLNELTTAAEETKGIIEAIENERQEKIKELNLKYNEKIKSAKEKQKSKTKELQSKIKEAQKELAKAASMLNMEPREKKSKSEAGDLLPIGTPEELTANLKTILKDETEGLKPKEIMAKLWGGDGTSSQERGRFNKLKNSDEFNAAFTKDGSKYVIK